ncbi:MAG: bifunctional 5,10-methylenetetrahydrofolate dehydrogenase/5,10-methenyltetrahydrofolate cyclohydrolase [Parcubacteria group bacterium]|jgi:methylenetetrahydrofolate dehydrogenase (NADP+)/methenyltetrahydrofolate cyclohydrolase
MKLLDGKRLAQKIQNNLKRQVSQMKKKPVLAMVLVGNDEASKIYVRNKKKSCEEVGIGSREVILPANISKIKLMAEIEKLNCDNKITGIILQLPIPKHLDKYEIIESIDPKKDADCLNHRNFGKFLQVGEKKSTVIPATAIGIIKIFEEYKIALSGKYAVVVGYSDIVGKPLAEMLLGRGATATICHDKTENLGKYTEKADILVVATGVENLIRGNMVKKGAVVIDAGIHRHGKKLSGDAEFSSVSKKASFITPVPGGVGPMTVAMLLWNTVRLAKK